MISPPRNAELLCDQWDAIVFDLDGTLVHLHVPWETVENRLRVEMQNVGIDTTNTSVWSLLSTAYEQELLDYIEPIINAYECAGATRSYPLPLSDVVSALSCPIAVCSLNCEAACRRALAVHSIIDDVDVVIGRDTIRPWKPDPAPLEAAIERLPTSPHQPVFIGDSDRDEQTAMAANVDFLPAKDAWHRTQD